MTDKPIAFREDGSPIFDNTASVICVAVFLDDGVVVIRRANEPKKGLLGLPGGHHMRGETWQAAGIREVYEETGIVIDNPKLWYVITDEYNKNVFFCTANFIRQDANELDANEVMEIKKINLQNFPKSSDWAFPLHENYVRDILNEG